MRNTKHQFPSSEQDSKRRHERPRGPMDDNTPPEWSARILRKGTLTGPASVVLTFPTRGGGTSQFFAPYSEIRHRKTFVDELSDYLPIFPAHVGANSKAQAEFIHKLVDDAPIELLPDKTGFVDSDTFVTHGEILHADGDHVVKVERCNGDDAWWQLRDAVEDGAVTCTEPLTENELDADEPAIKRIFPRIEQRIRRRSPAYWIVRYNGATRPIDRVWLLKESVFELWKDKVLAVKNSKEPASDDEICIALRNIFKDVESGKTRHWDLNSLHGWVEGAVSPKRVKKKEVLKIFRERSEFAQYQREKGRPKSAVAHLKDS